MLVAVDKFTKWIEAKPYTAAEATAAMNFVELNVYFVLACLIVSSQTMAPTSPLENSKNFATSLASN
jgi:hypothetical protein